MRKEATVIIPTRFNNRWMLDLNLRCIRKYTRYPYRIIVGDAGMDDEVKEFLSTQDDVRVTQCPDPLRPKNHLARIVETPYMMFLHDDAQIYKEGWIERRVAVMESDPRIAIVGELGFNFVYKRWQKLLPQPAYKRRFFPFALLLRKDVQEELDLHWGRIKGFDNGGVAYQQFQTQKKWRYRAFPFKHDVKHWGGMTWIMRKKLTGEKAYTDVNKLVAERELKVQHIRKLIEAEDY